MSIRSTYTGGHKRVILVKQVNRFHKKEDAHPTSPPPRSEVLLEEIRDLLKNR